MSERRPQTLRALSCVRLSFVPVSDIRNMLNYACVDNCKEAQKLLQCVICIKEGRLFAEEEGEGSSAEVQVSIAFFYICIFMFQVCICDGN